VIPLCVLVCFSVTPDAAEWTGRLYGGGDIRVDPSTNRATIQRGGVEAPLWDGTHVLEDGSTLIVRSGTVVPTQRILESGRVTEMDQARDWVGKAIVGYSPCERLVRRVCGDTQQCRSGTPCSVAEQLQGMEKEERAASDNPNLMTYTSDQCEQSLNDRTYFQACGEPARGLPEPEKSAALPQARVLGETAACQELVNKVCGAESRCAEAPSCGPARQLLEMATGETAAVDTSEAQRSPETQCREALSDEGFFAPCASQRVRP
jgi:hypothetical protein